MLVDINDLLAKLTGVIVSTRQVKVFRACASSQYGQSET
jgi:hypothetical protein